LGPRDLISSTPTHHAQLRAVSSSLGPQQSTSQCQGLKVVKTFNSFFITLFRFWKLDFVVIQLLNEASIKQAGSTSHAQVFQVLYVKRDVLIHVKHSTFVKLAELKAG
jgi:hypothetical protein